jgi:F0F1-type ATP synthase membrane subunit b/b'
MARKLTAAEMTDQATDLISQIREAAIAEARRELGAELKRLAKASAKEIGTVQEGQHEVTADYRAGMALMADLVADLDFDY